MANPIARPILLAGFRKSHPEKNISDAEAERIIIKQINLVRSAILHGMLGYLEPDEE